MINKQEIINLMQKISNVYGYFNKKSNQEKNAILSSYIKELNDYTYVEIANAIDTLSETNSFIPSVAEIKVAINSNKGLDFNNINLNSSFWYTNLRILCDEKNLKYFDIEKGLGSVLEPFKR